MAKRDDLLAAGRKALELTRDFNLRQEIEAGRNSVNIERLCFQLGVPVMYRPLKSLLGAYLKDPSPGILINTDRPASVQRLTCAHELGHFHLNHPTNIDSELGLFRGAESDYDTPVEQAADMFAIQLLMSKWHIVYLCKVKGWTLADLKLAPTIYQLSLRLGTSYQATVWTLLRDELLNLNEARVLARVQPKELKQSLLHDRALEDWHADVWLLDPRDRSRQFEARIGDVFLFLLEDSSTAGFVWEAVGSDGHAQVLEPLAEADSKSTAYVGGFDIRPHWLAVREASKEELAPTDLHLRHVRAWEVGEADVQVLDMQASVLVPRQGLSAYERQAILAAAA